MKRSFTAGTSWRRLVPQPPAPRLATRVVAAAFACIGLIGVAHVLLMPVGPGVIAVSVGCIVVLAATQLLWYGRGNARLAPRLGYAILAGQAALAYLPTLVLGQAWGGMPHLLPGSVPLVLHVLAWVLISTVTIGMVFYGLSRLTASAREMDKSARMAVRQERLRFARDLHDLLGYSLSAISHKIELVHRLMETSPQEAGEQLLEALEIARLASSDVRTVVSGYRELSLEEECRSVLSVLAAADIHARMDGEHVDVPVKVSTVLATVLREGVTNLLRHSKAENCQIIIGQTHDRASIEIVNDGPVKPTRKHDCGAGLRNLSARAEEIGGTVTVEQQPDLFRLRAEVPLQVDRCAMVRSEPARLAGDPDRIDPVAGGELVDDGRQVVPNRSD